ncbi:MAG TPA: PIN domain-containing protein [Spirochaetota bacterium]|nr:PIN domain-containing protein [Spirochaetota bacterium]HRZ25728.1 PIN domain-containing protein [Spirochaetota bacterium]HSA14335.1 PIN domain-containing protein [Spirochaetota bacterium]
MRDRLFIDSDIILDVALSRDPHYMSSSFILSLIELKKIDGFTSAIVISNFYYILRKLDSHKTAVDFIAKLRLIVRDYARSEIKVHTPDEYIQLKNITKGRKHG